MSERPAAGPGLGVTLDQEVVLGVLAVAIVMRDERAIGSLPEGERQAVEEWCVPYQRDSLERTSIVGELRPVTSRTTLLMPSAPTMRAPAAEGGQVRHPRLELQTYAQTATVPLQDLQQIEPGDPQEAEPVDRDALALVHDRLVVPGLQCRRDVTRGVRIGSGQERQRAIREDDPPAIGGAGRVCSTTVISCEASCFFIRRAK